MRPLSLTVDATIVFTGLIGTGVTKKLLFSDALTLFAPEFLFEEIRKHLSRIKLVSSLSPTEISILLSALESRISVVGHKKISPFLERAGTLTSDSNDAVYLAAALSLHASVWSNDSHFKEQSAVSVYTTKELVEFLKSRKLF